MQLIPVLEIKQGRAVHSEHQSSGINQVSDEPIALLNQWSQQGVSAIHLVDVDAITQREPVNVDLISAIKLRFPHLQIQVSGGIDCMNSAYIYMDSGVDQLVISGKVLKRQRFLLDLCMTFSGQVIAEVDSRQGKVSDISIQPQETSLELLSKSLVDSGVNQLIVTDIPDTGHVSYNNLLNVNSQAGAVNIPVFANGGN